MRASGRRSFAPILRRLRPSIGARGAILALVGVAAMAFATARPASAYSIASVAVSPTDPIQASDPVRIDVELWTPSSGAILYAPTQHSVSGSSISIVLFATTLCEQASPVAICDTVIGGLHDVVDLGPLAPGVYDVFVQTYRGSFLGAAPWDSETLSLTVVPEPATAVLIGLGLLVAARRSP